MSNKVKKYSIMTAGAFLLMASSAQAAIQMSQSSLCSVGDVTFNGYDWVTEETGAEIFVQTSLYGNTVVPAFLASSAWIMDYTDFSISPIYGFDTVKTDPGNYFSYSEVLIESTSTNPNQQLSAYSRITGPGVVYTRHNSTRLGNIPTIRHGHSVSCKRGTDYNYI